MAATLSASFANSEFWMSSLSLFAPSTTLVKPHCHMLLAALKPFCILPMGKASDNTFCIPLASCCSETEPDLVPASTVTGGRAAAAAELADQKSSATLASCIEPSGSRGVGCEDGGELMSNWATAPFASGAEAEAEVAGVAEAAAAVAAEAPLAEAADDAESAAATGSDPEATALPSLVSRASAPSSCNMPLNKSAWLGVEHLNSFGAEALSTQAAL